MRGASGGFYTTPTHQRNILCSGMCVQKCMYSLAGRITALHNLEYNRRNAARRSRIYLKNSQPFRINGRNLLLTLKRDGKNSRTQFLCSAGNLSVNCYLFEKIPLFITHRVSR